MPSLAWLRGRYPTRFHPVQDWFVGHRFMAMDLTGCTFLPPVDWASGLPEPDQLSDATLVAQSYLAHPKFWAWRQHRGVWTADLTDDGHRVYLQENGKGLEIHRYLAETTCPHCGGLVTPKNLGTLVWR